MKTEMKTAKKLRDLGQLAMVLGSLLFVVELFITENRMLTLAITLIYLAAMLLMLIGWFGTREERAAEKQRLREEAEAKKAARRAEKHH